MPRSSITQVATYKNKKTIIELQEYTGLTSTAILQDLTHTKATAILTIQNLEDTETQVTLSTYIVDPETYTQSRLLEDLIFSQTGVYPIEIPIHQLTHYSFDVTVTPPGKSAVFKLEILLVEP